MNVLNVFPPITLAAGVHQESWSVDEHTWEVAAYIADDKSNPPQILLKSEIKPIATSLKETVATIWGCRTRVESQIILQVWFSDFYRFFRAK